MVLGGPLLSARSQRLAEAISTELGCNVHLSRVARIELGNELPNLADLPYFPERLRAALADVPAAVMLGIDEPVSFFGYPDQPSQALPAGAERLVLVDARADLESELEALLEAIPQSSSVPTAGTDTPVVDATAVGGSVPAVHGPLTGRTIGQAFASGITAGSIVVAEAISSAAGYRQNASLAERHTLLAVLGGAIGGGLPAAVGAAVAAPDRPVLCLQADGSGLYTIQSLWTMAREQLDVTVVICANRTYKILEVELGRAGMAAVGQAKDLIDLDRPAISFTSLAAGFGVDAVEVNSCEELLAAMKSAAETPGPRLIEAVMA